MNKIKDFFKNIIVKIKEMTLVKKIALAILVFVAIMTIGILTYSIFSVKYEVLFSNLDPGDSKRVLDTLDEKKVKYKVDKDQNSIMVPEDEAGTLKLSLASELSGGSIGFSIFDESSQFGLTDSEFRIKYQRAVQGELEKTIKSFNEIENAKVNIVLPEDSTFVKDPTPAKAAVVLQLSPGVTLKREQVQAIVDLISMSVKDLPKENISISDTNSNLLTKDLFDENGDFANSSSVDKQLADKMKYEKYLEKKVLEQIEPLYGRGKVKPNISVDMDFDSVKTETTTTEKDPPKVSESTTINKDNGGEGANSESPVDNNMSNVTQEEALNDESITNFEQTTNYNTDGKRNESTVQAPGKVKRIQASILVDNNDLGLVEKEELQQLVNKAVGQINEDDTVVVGREFNLEDKQLAQEALEEMKKQEAAARRNKIILWSVIGGLLVLAIVAIVVIVLKRRKAKQELEEIEEEELLSMESEIQPKEFAPVTFEAQNEKTHFENEVKNYAKNKPEQVADIVKAWIANDEK